MPNQQAHHECRCDEYKEHAFHSSGWITYSSLFDNQPQARTNFPASNRKLIHLQAFLQRCFNFSTGSPRKRSNTYEDSKTSIGAEWMEVADCCHDYTRGSNRDVERWRLGASQTFTPVRRRWPPSFGRHFVRYGAKMVFCIPSPSFAPKKATSRNHGGQLSLRGRGRPHIFPTRPATIDLGRGLVVR